MVSRRLCPSYHRYHRPVVSMEEWRKHPYRTVISYTANCDPSRDVLNVNSRRAFYISLAQINESTTSSRNENIPPKTVSTPTIRTPPSKSFQTFASSNEIAIQSASVGTACKCPRFTNPVTVPLKCTSSTNTNFPIFSCRSSCT